MVCHHDRQNAGRFGPRIRSDSRECAPRQPFDDAAFLLAGPFSRFPPQLKRLDRGPAEGRWVIDFMCQGPMLEGMLGRANTVDGVRGRPEATGGRRRRCSRKPPKRLRLSARFSIRRAP